MEDEHGVLSLYDLHWFHRFVLFRTTTLPPPNDETPETSEESDRSDSLASESPPTLSDVAPLHCRSPAEELNTSTEIRVRNPPLQTILSGKFSNVDLDPIIPASVTVCEGGEQRLMRGRDRRRAKRRKKKEGSKSLSELEFEELKGFKDLGFTFSDAEASDPWLVSILPGLQRLREADGVESPVVDMPPSSDSIELQVAVRRPYLSEAWDTAEEEMGSVLRNWRIPAEGEGVVMKDHLRFWAHAVASAVR